MIYIPAFHGSLFDDRDATVRAVQSGIELAARHGAKLISATGIIPAATVGLLAAQAALEHSGLLTRHPQLRLTTGHETVVAAFALNVERICQAAGRDFNRELVTCVGLGHIGAAAVELLARLGYRPRALRLVDLISKKESLKELRDRLVDGCGYGGEIEIIAVEKGSTLPVELYSRTTFYLAATSQQEIIDVERLLPGAMVVDDSFPLGFDAHKAAHRIRTQGDILLTIAGALDGPHPVELFPRATGVAELDRYLGWIRGAAHATPNTLTGCVYSSVLAPHFGLEYQLGKVNPECALSHYRCYRDHGFSGAPIHLFLAGGVGSYVVEPSIIAAFRQRFGEIN
jgi:hypothetical protein